MYNSGLELLRLTDEHQCLISEIVLMKELQLNDYSKEIVFDKSRKILEVMKSSSSLAVKDKDS